jgi:ClpP class serine protease
MLELFTQPPVPQSNAEHADGAVQVVSVNGPLEQRPGAWFDDYESIRKRVCLALESTARAVVLRINSPGGCLYGTLDTARAIRADAARAGKPLVAFVDGDGCSAAYALACAADETVISSSAVVGSIGVLMAREDASVALSAQGVQVAFVTSGASKAYGRPELAMSERELADTQALVNQLAGPFIAYVAARRGLTTKAVAGYEAGQFTGVAAVQAGLADRLMSLDALIASLATPSKRKPVVNEGQLEGQLAQANKRIAALERQHDRPEVEALIKGQPKALRDALRNQPLRDVRAIVASLPKAEAAPSALMARIERQTRDHRPQKRVTKMINGCLYVDVPADYSPAKYGQ